MPDYLSSSPRTDVIEERADSYNLASGLQMCTIYTHHLYPPCTTNRYMPFKTIKPSFFSTLCRFWNGGSAHLKQHFPERTAVPMKAPLNHHCLIFKWDVQRHNFLRIILLMLGHGFKYFIICENMSLFSKHTFCRILFLPWLQLHV